ncbi:MAG: ParB/RepB/Spo0J family partition protein, partial [Phenylobacterium sp.]|uniref:ParB/RepB/Spo0J family partition protein n=1 Tax=Phenylobacterium sp. TaxID=1871053 RepID=UPI0025EA55C7
LQAADEEAVAAALGRVAATVGGTAYPPPADKLARLRCRLLGEAPAPAKAAAPAPDRPAGPRGLVDLPWNAIEPSPLNPRRTFDEAAIAELADSIAAAGLLQNLVVRPVSGDPAAPGGWWLISGERRWRAVGHLVETGRAAPDHPMPCRVVVADDREHLRMAIVENLQRQDVAPLEEAEAFAALRAGGWGTDEIAAAVGKTRRWVQLRLSLVDRLVEPAQALLRQGVITAEQARALATAPAERQAEILKSPPRTADEVRRRIRGDDGVPATRARFALALYDGPRWEDDRGETWLLDRHAVRALQRDWAGTEAVRLVADGEAAWAAVHEGWVSPGQVRRTDDPAAAGTLLRVAYDGSIETLEGVDRAWWGAWGAPPPAPPQDPATTAALQAEAAAEEAAWQTRRVAFDGFYDRLRERLADGHHHHVVQALLLHGFIADHPLPRPMVPAAALTAAETVWGPGRVTPREGGALLRFADGADVGKALLFAAASTAEDLGRLLGHCAARMIVETRWMAGQDPPPLVAALARALAVPVPDILTANAVREPEEASS